ncbi:MAG: ATP-binding protein [Actinobacteria bacterium]|nr:MAG: ATP-binding protein [Actinomycetota bacterium]
MRRLGEIRICGSTDQIDKVTEFVGNCGSRIGMRQRDILDIQISADEACSNAISHGYAKGEGEIHIACDYDHDSIVLTISDNGIPFDPLGIPEPDLAKELEQRRLGGLGIHLIRTLMDEVKYHRRGDANVLVMLKKLQ